MTERDDKKIFEERRFAIFTKESIKLIAEAAGISDLADDAAALLGEDVSYRLREATQNSTQYMKHAKRKKLTTEDFNKALKRADVQCIHGHNNPEGTSFRQTKEGEIFFVEDPEVSLGDIALGDHIPKNPGETSIKSHWLAVEGVSKATSSLQQTQGKPGKQEITEPLQKYYDNVTNAILGSDMEAMKVALNDLRTNPQIVPLLPYLVNFVSNGVKTVSYDIAQLTKLLHTVRALINNTSLYLEPQPYLNLLVQGVTYCLLEPLAASINPTNDHWVLRDYAARLLAQIVYCWSSPTNHLMYSLIKNLKDVLYDHAKPFCCHYGAVMGLKSLGSKAVEDVLIPHLPQYWPHLDAVTDDTSYANAVAKADAHKVYGAILLCVEDLLRKQIKKFETEISNNIDSSVVEFVQDRDSGVQSKSKKPSGQSTSGNMSIKTEPANETSLNSSVSSNSALPQELQKTISQFYNDMYEYFGDSLAIRLPDLNEKLNLKEKVYRAKKIESLVSLADPEACKSGEELLEEFMEQVKIQQKIDKERMEQERIQRQIDDERRARERKVMESHQKLMEATKRRLEEIKQAELEREREEMERLEHEQRRNKKIAGERIQKMLQENSDDEFEEEFVPYRQKRRSRSQVQYFPEAETAVVDNSDDDPSYTASGSTGMDMAVKSTVSDPKQGIKLIIKCPTKRPNIKIKPVEPQHQEKEVKRSPHHTQHHSQHHTHRTKASPHNRETKHSPKEHKHSPHIHGEARHSPHVHREAKNSPHLYREAKDSPHHYESREVKHSPHTSGIHREAKNSPHLKDQKDSKKKKKVSQKQTRKDEFEFESDPEDFTPFSFKSHHYSSEGESSDGTGHRKPLTLKLKVKDSKDFSSE